MGKIRLDTENHVAPSATPAQSARDLDDCVKYGKLLRMDG